MTQLRDAHNRQIDYLRMSVTDRCDFRCVYCMAEDMTFLPRQQVLGLEELERIAALPGLRELVMTTNGSQLVKLAAPLARAGVKRLNISLDSLDAEKFHAITRTGQLQSIAEATDT
jgi:cyclic pyranopterin phosphate synthase